jgi:hypothetical protein
LRGTKILATQARINIGGQYCEKFLPGTVTGKDHANYETNEDGQITAVNFRVRLERGSTRLSAWFINGMDDGGINGVYYVYITRL